MLNKRTEKGQKGKNAFFYLILVFMLVLSLKIHYERKNASVSAGNFGGEYKTQNVSFSDLLKNTSFGGESVKKWE